MSRRPLFARRPAEPATDDDIALVRSFLEGLVTAFGAEATVEFTTGEDGAIEAHVNGDDLGLMVGPKAATLTAIQELARAVLQRGGPGGPRLRVDVAGYREKRRAALERFTRMGEAYLAFAEEEPGFYAAMFSTRPEEGAPAGSSAGPWGRTAAESGTKGSRMGPWGAAAGADHVPGLGERQRRQAFRREHRVEAGDEVRRGVGQRAVEIEHGDGRLEGGRGRHGRPPQISSFVPLQGRAVPVKPDG